MKVGDELLVIDFMEVLSKLFFNYFKSLKLYNKTVKNYKDFYVQII